MFASYRKGTASWTDDECLWWKDGSGLQVDYGPTAMLKDVTLIGSVVSFTKITERKRAVFV